MPKGHPRPYPFSVLILAGGASRRMGRDKALLRIRGSRILDHLSEYYRGRAREVLVSCGSRRIPRLCFPQVPDGIPGRGPLSGLKAGLEAASGPWVLAVACDQPPLPDALLGLLWGSRRKVLAISLLERGAPLPFPSLFHRGILPAVDRLLRHGAGPRALHRMAPRRALLEEVWRKADPEGRAALDWDTPPAFRSLAPRWI